MPQYKLHPKLCPKNWKHFWQNLKQTDWVNNPAILNWVAYQRGYFDMAFFASYFFPHHCRLPFSEMHLDFCRAEMNPQKRGRREVIAAPRANAKTTFKLLIKVVHAICYEYESYILILTHSVPEASEKIQSILDELETNERLIRIFGELAPIRGQNKGPAQWGKKKFITQNGIRVVGKSRGQDIRGTKYKADRPTLIICDDIESLDGVLSPEQRLKTRNWFEKDVLKVGQVDGSTNIIVIGTCLHPESLLSELLHKPGFLASKYQSILSYATRQDLWEQWKRIYTDLSNPNRFEEQERFFNAHRKEMLEGAQVLWPEGEPYEYLIKMMVDEGVASFQSEKQNTPYDPDLQIFNMKAARRFSVTQAGGELQKIQWLDGSGKILTQKGIVEIIAFHDPAVGKKPGQSSEPDYAAIVVVASDTDGYLYCLDAYIEKDPISKQIERAFQLFDTWHFHKLILEENNFQVALKDLYQDVNLKRQGDRMRVKGITQTENKYKRISTLEPEITNGYLLFAENLSPRLIEQLELFPTSYVDGPDALQGAVSQIQRRSIRRRHMDHQGKNDNWRPPWAGYNHWF